MRTRLLDKESALRIFAPDGSDRSRVTGCETTFGGVRSGHRETAQGVIELRLPARAPALEPNSRRRPRRQSERPPVIHQCVDERATLLHFDCLRTVRRLRSLGDGWRRRRRRLTGLRGRLFGRGRSSGSRQLSLRNGGSSTGGGGAVRVCAAAGGGAAAAAPLELAADWPASRRARSS